MAISGRYGSISTLKRSGALLRTCMDANAQDGARFRVCCDDNDSKAHFHIYGMTPDARCCTQMHCRRPAHVPCRSNIAAYTVVLAEARVPALRMREFALLALPRDILAHVLAAHLDVLDRYVLAHVCTALCALYGGAAQNDAWRFRVWHDAMAAARSTALLDWLETRAPSLTMLSRLQHYWLWSCAALRDSVASLRWLTCHGVDFSTADIDIDMDALACTGCTRVLEYMLRACASRWSLSNLFALSAAQHGRLKTLRWLHVHDASYIDVEVMTEALRYGHAKCVYFLIGIMRAKRTNK